MPQFRQIDGVLASEMQEGFADQKTAIVALNQALDQDEDSKVLIRIMKNPVAGLSNIQDEHADKYKMVMMAEKRQKSEKEGLENNSAFLEHNEIQELIISLNSLMALQAIEDMVKSKNENGLIQAVRLLNPEITSKNESNLIKSVLMRELTSILHKNKMLRMQDVESAIKSAVNHGTNQKSTKVPDMDISIVVKKINDALENGKVVDLMDLLRLPCMNIVEHVLPFAGSLYFAELDFIRRGSGMDLRAEGIARVCKFLSTVAKINEAAQNKNYDKVFYLATREGANLEDLKVEMKTRYGEAMHTALIAKQKVSQANLRRAESEISCKLLNHADIQDCIDMVNSEEVDYEKIEAVKLVNDAVHSMDHKQLYLALQNPNLELEKNFEENRNITKGDSDQQQKANLICEEDSLLYLCLLRDIQRDRGCYSEKQSNKNEGMGELWMEDILEAVQHGLNSRYDAKSACFNLSILSMAVMQKDANHVFESLSKQDLNLNQNGLNLFEERKVEYMEQLYKLLNAKEDSGASDIWVEHILLSVDKKLPKVYLNLRDQKHAWRKPRDFTGARMSAYLSQDEIMTTLQHVNENWKHGTSVPPNFNVHRWTQFQARCRGNLVRNKIFTMLRHYYDNEQQIVKIQAFWKGKIQQKKYKNLLRQKVLIHEKILHFQLKFFNNINYKNYIFNFKIFQCRQKLLDTHNINAILYSTAVTKTK